MLIAAGATETLTAAILALARPGDEVLTIEPFYDSHAAAIALAGATHTTVPLVPSAGGFRLDLDVLRAAATDRTRLILVNTPHNPTGTVLTRVELEAIAAEAERVDAIVVTDEAMARRGHGPAATPEIPHDYAAYDEYWDYKSLTFLTKPDARRWPATVHTKISLGQWEPPAVVVI